ncbi:hypothetical protein PENSPDRAFT_681153 [Peniophora sp. CONT]|nr:hypothetical protein PENSPDRAFT_681153 [Peniophora sp. CONT]
MSHIYAAPSTGSSGSHTRGRSRSRNSPPRVAMPSPHFPVSAAPTYYQYQSSDPGHGYAPSHARHASYSGHPSQYPQMPGSAGTTYYVARSPSRGHHRRSESAGHRHHRSHSTTHHRSSSTAAPRHARHSSTTRHHSSVPHRSQSAMAARRHTYSQPQRRYSTHAHNLSFGDRIRKLLHIGRFGNHGKPYYVDSRGRELDRSGRPIVKY